MAPMLTKRRPAWVGWIPASILVVLIAGAVVFSVYLTSDGRNDQDRPPQAGEVTASGQSSFTAAGLAYIERSRELRIDLSDAPVNAGAIGLPDDGTVEVGPNELELDYSLVVYGGGAAPGGTRLVVPSLRITTVDGAVASLDTTLSEVQNFRNTLDDLRNDEELFGWQVGAIDPIFDGMAAATAAGTPYEFSVGPGSTIGFSITAEVSCPTGASCVVAYELVPSEG